MAVQVVMVEFVQSTTKPGSAIDYCGRDVYEFQAHEGREVTADFNGGHLSSDGGLFSTREVENNRGMLGKLANYFSDLRFQPCVEHSLRSCCASISGPWH